MITTTPTVSASFLSDIPESLAYAAHSGTSWVPERRAVSTRAEYAQTLVNIKAELSRHAKTDEARAVLEIEFARFHEGYCRRYRAYLASRSRIVSSMIAGPSNFPARRMEKRGDIAHKRLGEFLDFRKRATEAIIRTLHPEWRPIMAGDDNAVERLSEKIEQAEALQERMKAANSAIRKYKMAGAAAQVLALVAIGFKEAIARKLLEPDFCGRIGFADYQLTNNNANLRRMKARLASISEAKATSETELAGINARFVDCPPENRVRLHFPGRPSAEVRTQMKSAGFRWAPSLDAWQAYRNHSTLALARLLAGVDQAEASMTAA